MLADQQAAALAQTSGPARAQQEFRSLSRPEQRRVLVELIEQGRSDEEIGKVYGLSQWQVRNMRYRLGIKKDRGGNIHIEPMDARTGEVGIGAAGMLHGFPSLQDGGRELFAVTVTGIMDAGRLARRLEGMRALFDSADPEKRFEVRIQVTEAAEEE